MTAVLVLTSVLAMAAGSKSGLGFDASTPVSVNSFKQLSAAGYNYTILRGYRSKSGGESVRRWSSSNSQVSDFFEASEAQTGPEEAL